MPSEKMNILALENHNLATEIKSLNQQHQQTVNGIYNSNI